MALTFSFAPFDGKVENYLAFRNSIVDEAYQNNEYKSNLLASILDPTGPEYQNSHGVEWPFVPLENPIPPAAVDANPTSAQFNAFQIANAIYSRERLIYVAVTACLSAFRKAIIVGLPASVVAKFTHHDFGELLAELDRLFVKVGPVDLGKLRSQLSIMFVPGSELDEHNYNHIRVHNTFAAAKVPFSDFHKV
jgi:hypothetical protein